MYRSAGQTKPTKLSVVVPCYNERDTLTDCIRRLLEIRDEFLSLEIVIVDDGSTDGTLLKARELANAHTEVSVLHHDKNRGKGAAVRTGVKQATGDYVAVQDADLEYDPQDLRRLLIPLIEGDADVVFGSRFLSSGAHRVLYFWHYLGNRLLTFVSNMFTDLNLTDMEAGYKVFRREVIQRIDIEESRFGFEPEIVAKVAHMRLRVYEIGVSYHGRTYAEGKKIRPRDSVRALYCIFRYSAHRAPIPIQFMMYVFIGGVAAVFNLFLFLGLVSAGVSTTISAPSAFVAAAVLNYLLCIWLLFKHRARWKSTAEILVYSLVVGLVALLDLGMTQLFLASGASPARSKMVATLVALFLNFVGRRFVVFPEPSSGAWKARRDMTYLE